MNITNYVSSLRIPEEGFAVWVLDNALKHSTLHSDAVELYCLLFEEIPDEYVPSYTRHHQLVKDMIADILNVCSTLPPTTNILSVSLSQARGRDYVINLEVRH